MTLHLQVDLWMLVALTSLVLLHWIALSLLRLKYSNAQKVVGWVILIYAAMGFLQAASQLRDLIVLLRRGL